MILQLPQDSKRSDQLSKKVHSRTPTERFWEGLQNSPKGKQIKQNTNHVFVQMFLVVSDHLVGGVEKSSVLKSRIAWYDLRLVIVSGLAPKNPLVFQSTQTRSKVLSKQTYLGRDSLRKKWVMVNG